MTSCANKFIDDNQHAGGFGAHIVAYCTDGAQACLNSATETMSQLHIIPVRCQLHAIALAIKHLFEHIDFFQDVEAKASLVIDAFRSNGRLSTLLKEKSDGKSLLRFVPVRCGIHWAVLRQLLKLKAALYSACNDELFSAYVSGLPDHSKRSQMTDVKEIIEDIQFWKSVAFVVDVLTPLLVVLKIFDRSSALAGYIHWLWSLLDESVSVQCGKEGHEWVDVEVKQTIRQSIANDYLGECSDVFDVAYILNPHFYDEIFVRASSITTDGSWDDLKSTGYSILDIFLKRDHLTKCRTLRDITIETHELRTSFQNYYLRRDKFQNAKSCPKNEDPILWWDMTCSSSSLLKRYAIRILHIAHSVSDVERNHKVTSLIHTSTRNRLKLEKVDMLTKANLAWRNELAVRAPRSRFGLLPEEMTKLVRLSDDEEGALQRFTHQTQVALEGTLTSLSHESSEGEIGTVTAEASETLVDESIVAELYQGHSSASDQEQPYVTRRGRTVRRLQPPIILTNGD